MVNLGSKWMGITLDKDMKMLRELCRGPKKKKGECEMWVSRSRHWTGETARERMV